MTVFVALLRAVNVGGTGKLPMATLVDICNDAGFTDVRTYIASGNVVFRSTLTEAKVRSALEARLHAYAGKPVGVLVRTAREMSEVLDRNPFSNEAGNRVMALFSDAALPVDPNEGATGTRDEQLRLGPRALYVFYPSGMGTSKLKVPCAKDGTGRNMNTVAKLVEMAAALG
ncbi:DUF1697 domain-containing protein [Pararobbsia alpina]|uniref:DUF1697 domain-containing protein n=1 Tax=Pararobbsia alpina TaxID=621374 RepID=UPI0039A711E5